MCQMLPQWWGSGYAEEVARCILHYAFTELHHTKILAETQAANIASRRLLEKLDMTLERTVERFGEVQCVYGIDFIQKITKWCYNTLNQH